MDINIGLFSVWWEALLLYDNEELANESLGNRQQTGHEN